MTDNKKTTLQGAARAGACVGRGLGRRVVLGSQAKRLSHRIRTLAGQGGKKRVHMGSEDADEQRRY